MLSHKIENAELSNMQARDAVAAMGLYARIVDSVMTGGPVRGYIRTTRELPAIKEQMEQKGWLFSGSGYFSAVFVRGAIAVKIGLKKEDSGAMYAAWCRANQGKPGVPVIHAIAHFANCYIVVMDRLFPLDTSDAYTACEYAEVAEVFHGKPEPDSIFAVVSTARSIKEFFSGVASFDITRNNVMQDVEGNLVITDPVSYAADNDNGYTYYSTESKSVKS